MSSTRTSATTALSVLAAVALAVLVAGTIGAAVALPRTPDVVIAPPPTSEPADPITTPLPTTSDAVVASDVATTGPLLTTTAPPTTVSVEPTSSPATAPSPPSTGPPATSDPSEQIVATVIDDFAIRLGDTVSDGVPGPGAGNIEAGGDEDSYAFAAAAGDFAIFDVVAGRASDFRWTLTAPDGAIVFDGRFTDRLVEVTQDGTHVLTVRGATAGSTGTYSFRLSAPPVPDFFAIDFGDTVADGEPGDGAGNIEVPGAADIYTFAGTAGQVAIFDHFAGRNTDIRWRLEAPDGSQPFNTSIGDQQVALPADGNYVLTIGGVDIGDTGTYSFRLFEAPAPDQFDITGGDTVSDGVPDPGAGNIEVVGATDVYAFVGAAGQTAVFDHLAGDDTAIGWRLDAPDGSELFDTFIGDEEVPLPVSGTYTLTVSGLGIDDTGAYSFQLLDVTPPPQQFLIAFGDTVRQDVPDPGAGNIEVAGATDIYAFEFIGTPGLTAIFDHLSGDNTDIAWRLVSPRGQLLFDTSIGDQDVVLPTRGTYTLTVEGNTIDDTGSYSFQLLDAPAAQQFAIAIGDTVADGVPVLGAGNIEVPGAADVYSFDANAGQVVFFSRIAFGSDLAWRLTAPDGSVVFDLPFADQLTELTESGTYTLRVAGESPTDLGVYEFDLLDVTDSIDEFEIGVGDNVDPDFPSPGAGNLEAPGAVDVYTFDARERQEVFFESVGGTDVDFSWRLTAPDGAPVFAAGALVSQQVTLPQDGTYTLVVSGSDSTITGPYSFRLFEVAAPEEFAIRIGEEVDDGVPAAGAGNIEVPGAVDIYRFDAEALQGATLRVFDSNEDLAWRVTAPDGSVVVARTPIDLDELLILRQTGTYTITVEGFALDGTGTYGFRLSVAPDAEQFAIGFGDTVSDGVPESGAGNIEEPGSVDHYVFAATAEQVANIHALGTTFDVSWSLTAPDGTVVLRDPELSGDTIETLSQTGTYTLTLHSRFAFDRGLYSFQLLDVTPANSDPLAVDDAVETDEDTAVTIDVLTNDSDPDGDTLVIDSVTQPGSGTAAIGSADVVYTPAPETVGAVAFTYTVSDGNGGTATAAVTVAISPVNDAPSIDSIPDQADVEGDAVTIDVAADDADAADRDDLAFGATGLPDGITVDPATGQLSGTIATGAATGSPYTVEITVTDPDGAATSTTFTWTITPAGNQPLEADIDVRLPCTPSNLVIAIPVAIFGGPDVNVGRIDVETLELEGMPVARLFGSPVSIRLDVNGDGAGDLVVLFDMVPGTIPVGTTEVTLTGQLDSGITITGTDEICLT